MNPHDSLTLVLNPNARKPRLRAPSLDEMRALLGNGANIHVTKDLDELDRLMSEWKSHEETLCFYGGDGSIARGLTSLIRHRGESSALPPVLAVRAGTINMLCTVIGHKEDCNKTFERWKSGQMLALKEIPLLKVEVEGQAPLFGFVMAWGIGFRVLRDYYARSPAPNVYDGMVSFAKALYTAVHPKGSDAPLFRTEDLKLKINGEPKGAPLRALTLGTIPRLSLGMRPFAPVPVKPGCFHLTGHGISRPLIVRHLATIGFGVGDLRKLDCGEKLVVGENVSELECELSEGFTMDGEMFELPARTRVRVSAGPVVRFWAVK